MFSHGKLASLLENKGHFRSENYPYRPHSHCGVTQAHPLKVNVAPHPEGILGTNRGAAAFDVGVDRHMCWGAPCQSGWLIYEQVPLFRDNRLKNETQTLDAEQPAQHPVPWEIESQPIFFPSQKLAALE